MAALVYDKLDYLDDTKTLIRAAIMSKGIPINDSDTFRSYIDKIASIKSATSDKNWIGCKVISCSGSSTTKVKKVYENNIESLVVGS